MILFLGQTMKSFDRAAFAAQPQKMLFQTAFTAFGGAADHDARKTFPMFCVKGSMTGTKNIKEDGYVYFFRGHRPVGGYLRLR